MDITHKSLDNKTTLLKLHGQLSVDTVEPFKQAVQSLINEDSKQIILNMGLVNYVSSAGIQGIYIVLDMISAAQGKLILCCLTPNVKKVVDMVAMGDDVSIFTTEEEAVQAMLK